MAQVITGREGLFGQFKKAGMLPDNCRRIVIDIEVNELVKVYYETFGDDQLVAIDIPQYLGPIISGNKVECELKEKPDGQA